MGDVGEDEGNDNGGDGGGGATRLNLGAILSTLGGRAASDFPCDTEKSAFDWVTEGNVERLKALAMTGGLDIHQQDDQVPVTSVLSITLESIGIAS